MRYKAKAVTHTSCRRVACAGVAVHSVTSRVYTVAVTVDGAKELGAGHGVNDDDTGLEELRVNLPGGGTSVVRTHSRWRALASVRSGRGVRQITPLWRAWERMAERFSQETLLLCGGGGGGGGWTALVMDNKLLHVSTAVSSAAKHVFAIVPSPVEAALACEMLTSLSNTTSSSPSPPPPPSSSNIRVIVESVSRATMKDSRVLLSESTNPSACRSVWLSYHATKAMGAAELHRCDKWSDVNNLLERGWINATSAAASCLGVHVKYSNVGLVWEHAHVDWLISGMQRAACAHGLLFETRYVCDFTFRAPHVVVIFKVTKSEEEEEEEEVAAGNGSLDDDDNTTMAVTDATMIPLPQHFKEWNGTWAMIGQVAPAAAVVASGEDCSSAEDAAEDAAAAATATAAAAKSSTSTMAGDPPRRRQRIPSSSSKKYARNVVPWISNLVKACGLSSCGAVLAEPGFNYVMPALLQATSRLVCSAGNDHIQFAELQSRHTRHLADSALLRCVLGAPSLVGRPTQRPKTAVLLSDGGARAWRSTWFKWTCRWISGLLSGARDGSVSVTSDSDATTCAGVLVMLASASKDTSQMSDLVKDLEASSTSAGVIVSSLPIHYFHWEHVPFGYVAIVFGDLCEQSKLDRVEEVWAAAQTLGAEKKNSTSTSKKDKKNTKKNNEKKKRKKKKNGI